MVGGPMETERIALSQRERERLKVLHEVKQKHLTQVEAGSMEFGAAAHAVAAFTRF